MTAMDEQLAPQLFGLVGQLERPGKIEREELKPNPCGIPVHFVDVTT
jgi:hypothetical protein